MILLFPCQDLRVFSLKLYFINSSLCLHIGYSQQMHVTVFIKNTCYDAQEPMWSSTKCKLMGITSSQQVARTSLHSKIVYQMSRNRQKRVSLLKQAYENNTFPADIKRVNEYMKLIVNFCVPYSVAGCFSNLMSVENGPKPKTYCVFKLA